MLAEREEVFEGALVDGVEAGLVAVEEVEFVGVVEFGEGVHQAVGGGGGGLVGHGGIEVAVFDGPGAAEAPVGGDHFLDEADFDGVQGAEALGVGEEEFAEGFGWFLFEDDDSGKEAVAAGVLRGAGFAAGGFGASGLGAVGAGGGDLLFRAHRDLSEMRIHFGISGLDGIC